MGWGLEWRQGGERERGSKRKKRGRKGEIKRERALIASDRTLPHLESTHTLSKILPSLPYTIIIDIKSIIVPYPFYQVEFLESSPASQYGSPGLSG